MPRAWRALLLLACTWPSVAAPGPRADVASELSAPPELLAALPPRATDRHLPTTARVQAIMDFMTGDAGLALRYREQPTFGIAESYARREVNCVSFSLMFIAVARASGIRAHAQASDDVLATGMQGGLVYRVTHMNAGVDADGLVYAVDVGWRDVLAERKPGRITDARAVALLHGNRAMERLLQDDVAGAAVEVDMALELDASAANSWSNAGVVRAREGQPAAAERAYLRALQIDRGNVAALGNLVNLYRAQGDDARASAYEERLNRVQASDPFSQYLIGQQQVQAGAYGDAIAHYRRAIRLLPLQPVFYRGLAEAYRRNGDAPAAQRAERRAQAIESETAESHRIRDANGSG